MKTKSDGVEIASSCGAIGCACIVQVVFYASIAAVVVLAVRWALTTHAFGL